MKNILFLLFLFVGCANLPDKRTDKLSILQGITNSKEVEFSIIANKGALLRFELRSESGDIIAPDETKIVTRDFSDFAIHKIVFTRDVSKEFNLYVYQNEKVVDQRLVGRGQKEQSKLKLVVASCLNDFFADHFKIWDQVAKENPEYLLLIGDNVYATRTGPAVAIETDPEIIWKRYMDIRLTLPLYYQQKLIPTHAVWDDNDYGKKDADRTFSHKEASKEIFEAFWAQDLSDDDWSKGYGVGGLLSLGDYNLYFLDSRSFRSPSKQESHLGLDQTAWLYSKLREEASPSFIIKGDQFFGGYHNFDSFEGSHPEDFNNFVNELKGIPTPFIFLSGDRHMSEIMQFPRSLFGKPSFEITSSPLHARIFNTEDKNPWRVVSQINKMNFTVIQNVAEENHWFLDVHNIGEKGETNYRRELAVYIKDLQDNLKEIRKRRSGKRRYKKIRPSRGRRR